MFLTMMAGTQQAGAFPALVALLRSEVEPVAAELAAVVLRNLALGNSLNRSALVQTDGLAPLLRLLSEGQDRLTYPMRCQARPCLHGKGVGTLPLDEATCHAHS